MKLNTKIEEELEGRIKGLEDFIAEKGVGSKQLRKAKKVQRDSNIALVVGGLLTITGLAIWALNRNNDDS
ncbi:hypothetical protein [Psychroflexus halocasei]|uniref:Uncharacterized protein n=1 Tax=Psychroflexus halocasei TaxID=908615 RepID=A0A1H3VGC9_9FLAO|nr:hypothetical protein [Psychroflexus halocasei]SDZ73192.1 hypothetical protein SAMN05421540_10147 [Psychroflexus halocasei]